MKNEPKDMNEDVAESLGKLSNVANWFAKDSAWAHRQVPRLQSIVRELLILHQVHHNHPIHARARELLAEDAGSTWSNPIWHGRWRIYRSDYVPVRGMEFTFTHDDYDGAPDAYDNRHGHAPSVEDAKAQIDEFEDKD